MLQLQQPLRDDSAARLHRLRQGCRSRTSTNQFGPWRGANLATMPSADFCGRTGLIAVLRARCGHRARTADLPE